MEIQKSLLGIKDKLHICTKIVENLANQKCYLQQWINIQNVRITDSNLETYTYIQGTQLTTCGSVIIRMLEAITDIESILIFLLSCDFDYLLPLYSMSQMDLSIYFINDLDDIFDVPFDDNDQTMKAKAMFEYLMGG